MEEISEFLGIKIVVNPELPEDGALLVVDKDNYVAIINIGDNND